MACPDNPTAAVLSRRSLADPASRLRAAVLVAAALLASHGAPRADEPPAGSGGPSFDFSGSQRTRYESLDPQFRQGFDGSDRVLALQTTLVFDVKFDALQFYAELMDSRAELNHVTSC